MSEFKMPSLGADMEAGTLVAWKRAPGDVIRRGDVIAEVETEKGIIEVEVFEDGVVDALLVPPGTKVPVGTPLARLRTAGAPPTPAPAPAAATPSTAPSTAPSPAPSTPSVPAQRVRISPAARHRALELGVDPERITPTGPDGAVTLDDVERAGKAPGPRAPGADREAAMRRAVGAAMARSKREIPHYYLAHTVDLGPASAWLAAYNAGRPPAERLVLGVLLIKAVVLALRRVPELNARWTGESAPRLADVHAGLAVALRGGGLVAPAIHHTDRLSLPELMKAMTDLVGRAREGTLRSSELTDPTITISSLGERGVELVFPVIHPPQVAMVGIGAVVERPWVVAGAVVARPVATFTLAGDHRVSDGHRGGLYLAEIQALLQKPEAL